MAIQLEPAPLKMQLDQMMTEKLFFLSKLLLSRAMLLLISWFCETFSFLKTVLSRAMLLFMVFVITLDKHYVNLAGLYKKA